MREGLENDIRDQLVKIANGLNAAGPLRFLTADIINFKASLALFSYDNDSERDDQQCIAQMLGPKAEVRQVEETSVPDMLAMVGECIGWTGDDGAHPNHTYQLSKEFESDFENLIRGLNALLEGHSQIISFDLESGHPFYPVFWDFAFLIRTPGTGYVLIGSSSD